MQEGRAAETQQDAVTGGMTAVTGAGAMTPDAGMMTEATADVTDHQGGNPTEISMMTGPDKMTGGTGHVGRTQEAARGLRN